MKEYSPIEVVDLPEWAAQSHRTFAEQYVFIQQFPAYVFPAVPPFRISPYSIDKDGWYFVYMGNRTQDRYTYLFEKRPEVEEILHYPIQIGYTNLYVLRKHKYFPGSPTLLFKENVRKLSKGSPGDYLVLQDPLMKCDQSYHDILFTGSVEECQEMAAALSSKSRCALVVAELVRNEFWH
jgi:hypothetical protein